VAERGRGPDPPDARAEAAGRQVVASRRPDASALADAREARGSRRVANRLVANRLVVSPRAAVAAAVASPRRRDARAAEENRRQDERAVARHAGNPVDRRESPAGGSPVARGVALSHR
jgi:hypothetical protein